MPNGGDARVRILHASVIVRAGADRPRRHADVASGRITAWRHANRLIERSLADPAPSLYPAYTADGPSARSSTYTAAAAPLTSRQVSASTPISPAPATTPQRRSGRVRAGDLIWSNGRATTNAQPGEIASSTPAASPNDLLVRRRAASSAGLAPRRCVRRSAFRQRSSTCRSRNSTYALLEQQFTEKPARKPGGNTRPPIPGIPVSGGTKGRRGQRSSTVNPVGRPRIASWSATSLGSGGVRRARKDRPGRRRHRSRRVQRYLTARSPLTPSPRDRHPPALIRPRTCSAVAIGRRIVPSRRFDRAVNVRRGVDCPGRSGGTPSVDLVLFWTTSTDWSVLDACDVPAVADRKHVWLRSPACVTARLRGDSRAGTATRGGALFRARRRESEVSCGACTRLTTSLATLC